jgi:hypothetical protein
MVPLVRVASTLAWHAKLPPDLGALGICFPMTTTRDAAAAAVRAARNPLRGGWYWGLSMPRWARYHAGCRCSGRGRLRQAYCSDYAPAPARPIGPSPATRRPIARGVSGFDVNRPYLLTEMVRKLDEGG